MTLTDLPFAFDAAAAASSKAAAAAAAASRLLSPTTTTKVAGCQSQACVSLSEEFISASARMSISSLCPALTAYSGLMDFQNIHRGRQLRFAAAAFVTFIAPDGTRG